MTRRSVNNVASVMSQVKFSSFCRSLYKWMVLIPMTLVKIAMASTISRFGETKIEATGKQGQYRRINKTFMNIYKYLACKVSNNYNLNED